MVRSVKKVASQGACCYPDFMNNFMTIWLILALVFFLLEFILPGLVVFFVGLGAATVSLSIFFELVSSENLLWQIEIFFISTMIYCLTLRFLAIAFYRKFFSKNADGSADFESNPINEDASYIGLKLILSEVDEGGLGGRVVHDGTTWKVALEPSLIQNGLKLTLGDRVEVLKRDNIALIVKI